MVTLVRRVFVVLALANLIGCGDKPSPTTATVEPAKPFAAEPLGEKPGLHNVYRVTDQLISGSSPEGDAGFESLKTLGVQSIISVDGAKPEVERAERFGMKYVHLPIGYDGISEQRALQLAKAVRDLPAPIYIHCHHGKHRGPTAAVTAVRCLDDRCGVDDALKAMETIGTDQKYTGLYATAKRSKPLDPAKLDELSLDFPSTSTTPPQIDLMVTIDERFDHLKLIQKAGWTTPKSHPDLVPSQEALILMEQFRELARVPDTFRKPREYSHWVGEAEKNASDLEQLIRDKAEPAKLDAGLAKIQSDCARCHKAYRDNK